MIKEQIVMFGGCFNPPLNSHFLLAQQLLNEYKNIKKVIFVPVNSKYQKNSLEGNESRYEMLKLICDQNENFSVSRLEMDSSRPLYTIETLRALQKLYPKNEIAFMVGSDNLKEINTWKEANILASEFKIYVFKRDEDNINKIIESSLFLKENKQAFIKIENSIISNMSSTFVRESIKKGKSIKYLAPDEIVDYIKNKKLYK